MINNFILQELVPRHVYNQFGEKSWWFLDYKTLKTLEWLRYFNGSCTVNNWCWGGDFDQRGLRTYDFYMQNGDLTPIYIAKEKIAESFSQHKYGRAFDCSFKDYTAEEVREFIKQAWEEDGYDWPITLEEDVSWLHFDTRLQPENKVYTFKP